MGHKVKTDNEPQIEQYPILEAWPEFFWMNERDRSDTFESRARAYGGEGYRHHSREK